MEVAIAIKINALINAIHMFYITEHFKIFMKGFLKSGDCRSILIAFN